MRINRLLARGVSIISFEAEMMMMTEADIAATMAFETATDDLAGDDQTPADPEALTGFILERYHETHRRELAELEALALRVEAVHVAHQDCPTGLAKFLSAAAQSLDAHMQKEERMLFPALLAGGGGCAPYAMHRMRVEHVEHDIILDELKRRTNAFTPPQDACGSWRRLYAGCAKLSADLRAHIETENNVLFPMFERGDPLK